MAQLIGSAVVQSLAFAGGNWLFKQFDPDNHAKEQKRHDLALEKYTRERNTFFEEETRRKDKMAKLAQEKEAAKDDFTRTNRLFEQLAQLQKEQKNAVEPSFDDYYEESDEFKKYQMVATALISLASGASLGGVAWSMLV